MLAQPLRRVALWARASVALPARVRSFAAATALLLAARRLPTNDLSHGRRRIPLSYRACRSFRGPQTGPEFLFQLGEADDIGPGRPGEQVVDRGAREVATCSHVGEVRVGERVPEPDRDRSHVPGGDGRIPGEQSVRPLPGDEEAGRMSPGSGSASPCHGPTLGGTPRWDGAVRGATGRLRRSARALAVVALRCVHREGTERARMRLLADLDSIESSLPEVFASRTSCGPSFKSRSSR